MNPVIKKLFRAPYGVPNALQAIRGQLWIADQITDRLALVKLTDPSEYGVTHFERDIASDSSNTSGMAVGGGSLWLAANGDASLWRPGRHRDAQSGQGEILEVDPGTGVTRNRWSIPGGGGVHGIEYDPLEDGILWITTLKSQTLSKVRIADWSPLHVIELPYERAHGVVRVQDGIWVVHTSDRVIVKLEIENGREIDRINVSSEHPQPHGLSSYGSNLLYCDATSGWIVQIDLEGCK